MILMVCEATSMASTIGRSKGVRQGSANLPGDHTAKPFQLGEADGGNDSRPPMRLDAFSLLNGRHEVSLAQHAEHAAVSQMGTAAIPWSRRSPAILATVLSGRAVGHDVGRD
jgi:hypothetical protein